MLEEEVLEVGGIRRECKKEKIFERRMLEGDRVKISCISVRGS